MSTIIRPELSEKNKYWVEKHRYYELKHFCLQYPLWKKAYAAFSEASYPSGPPLIPGKTKDISAPTEETAQILCCYSDKISLVERIAREAAFDLWKYLLRGVTEEVSYDHLLVMYDIPCSKDTYYELYRKFFYLLSKERN